jgi:hypothetical protein
MLGLALLALALILLLVVAPGAFLYQSLKYEGPRET